MQYERSWTALALVTRLGYIIVTLGADRTAPLPGRVGSAAPRAAAGLPPSHWGPRVQLIQTPGVTTPRPIFTPLQAPSHTVCTLVDQVVERLG